jgi:hypothetical protein
LIALLRGFFLGSDGSCNGTRADHSENRIRNGVVDSQTAKGDATRLATVQPTAAAAVAGNVVLCARVAKRHLASVATAAEQSCQQSVAVLGRAVTAAGGYVATNDRQFASLTLTRVRPAHDDQPQWRGACPW